MEAQRHLLPDGRWHYQHGPIDIVIGADGDALALKLAHEAAWQRFRTVLQELVSELRPMLQVGDIVVVLGAGNIHGVAEELVHSLVGGQTATWTVQ